jgi:BioD-like phosphotransacetylase family protein
MKKLLIASNRKSAGKTSIIVGVSSAFEKKYGYIKPFGDRLFYRRKRNWDYDCVLIRNLWELDMDIESEDITLGFHHSKLRYVYNQESTKSRLGEMAQKAGEGKDILFIEGGQDHIYGSSINLDSLSIADYLKAEVIFVVSGDNDTILDDIYFIKKDRDIKRINIKGVIINKVKDIDSFKTAFSKQFEDLGVNVLGIIPFQEQLTFLTMDYLSKKLVAKVIAGEKGLNNIIKHVFVGAMSTPEAQRSRLFYKENKLIITSGDRSDMILAALKSDSAGIVLTNNIVPPSNIISEASERNIPLLMAPRDTFKIAKQIDNMEALLSSDDTENVNLLKVLIRKHVNIEDLLK